jgi:hypothetical protein
VAQGKLAQSESPASEVDATDEPAIASLVWQFDDSHTAVVEAKDVVTPAAYVLMYGRRNVAARAEHGSPERE